MSEFKGWVIIVSLIIFGMMIISFVVIHQDKQLKQSDKNLKRSEAILQRCEDLARKREDKE